MELAVGGAAGAAGAVLGGDQVGVGTLEAGRAAGVGQVLAFAWFKQAGGVKANGPRPAGGRYLLVAEREEIVDGLAAGESLRKIAGRLGRAPSTVSREVAATTGGAALRAQAAEGRAQRWAARPKTAKLAGAPGCERGWRTSWKRAGRRSKSR